MNEEAAAEEAPRPGHAGSEYGANHTHDGFRGVGWMQLKTVDDYIASNGGNDDVDEEHGQLSGWCIRGIGAPAEDYDSVGRCVLGF